MVSKKGNEGSNVSYLLVASSDCASKMTLKLKVNSFKNGKSSGAYVGAFQTKGDYLYNSIGFRGTGDNNAVSPYWIKVNSSDSTKDGNAGNGGPKNTLNENATYEVTIEKRSDGYYASYKEEGGSTVYEKTFKSSEAYLQPIRQHSLVLRLTVLILQYRILCLRTVKAIHYTTRTMLIRSNQLLSALIC